MGSAAIVKEFMKLKKSIAVALGLWAAAFSSATTLNPFYADIETEHGSFFAVRPFYSHAAIAEGAVQDVFWPLYSRKQFKDEQTSRILVFWYTHHFERSVEGSRYRRWLLPVYFQGRSGGGENYLALFPLGGTIYDFMGRDEIRFVLFPVYGRSRVNDLETLSVLWPVYSRTRGDGIRRDRVFPLYGKSVKDGSYEKRFILWPFWTEAVYEHPGHSGRVRILFPVYGRADMQQEQTLWLLPPFFRFTEGREQRTYCPWPFFQKIDGEGYDKLHLWPFWGRSRMEENNNERHFVLWPIWRSDRVERQDLLYIRQMAVPFFYLRRGVELKPADSAEKPETVYRHLRLWPLMSSLRDGDLTRFRMLELWPVASRAAPVERNWAPLWTLYSRTEQDSVVRRDVLWFAWSSRRNAATGCKEWSLLNGLFSCRQDESGRHTRFLWLPRRQAQEPIP